MNATPTKNIYKALYSGYSGLMKAIGFHLTKPLFLGGGGYIGGVGRLTRP